MSLFPVIRRTVLIILCIASPFAGTSCAGAAEEPPAVAKAAEALAPCLTSISRSCVLSASVKIALQADRPQDRAGYLLRIAKLQAKFGLREGAETTARLALQFVDPKEAFLIGDIADVLAMLGKFDDALQIAKRPDNATSAASLASAAIAIRLAQAGRLPESLELLRGLTPDWRHGEIRRLAWTLRYAAIERGEEGRLIDELRVIDRDEERPGFWTGVHHPSVFPPALHIITEGLANVGKFDEAWRHAISINHPVERVESLGQIGAIEVNAGGIVSALRRVTAIDDAKLRSNVLAGMYRPRREAKIEALMQGDESQPEPRTAPATGEDIREALVIARLLPRERDRSFVLGIVATAQDRSQDFAGARETAETISDPLLRCSSLMSIGRAQTTAGHAAEAKGTFEAAFALARAFDGRPDDSGLRDRYLSDVAIGMAKAGLVKEAVDVVAAMEGNLSNSSIGIGYETGGDDPLAVPAKMVNTDSERRWALYEIARAQAKAGMIDEALTNARSTSLGHSHIASGMSVVATGLAKAGRIDGAIRIAKSSLSSDYNNRDEALSEIVQERALAGQIAHAVMAANVIENGAEKSIAQAVLGEAWLRAGKKAEAEAHFARALSVAQGIKYDSPRFGALLFAAMKMPAE